MTNNAKASRPTKRKTNLQNGMTSKPFQNNKLPLKQNKTLYHQNDWFEPNLRKVCARVWCIFYIKFVVMWILVKVGVGG